MPTRRPRLVQEGKPIYGGDNDHFMDEAERHSPSGAPIAASLSHQHAPHFHQLAPGPSSLAMAAGGSVPIRPPHISTKLVVEQHDDDESLDHHYEGDAMAVSPPRQAHSPPHKTSPLRMRLVIGGESQNQQQHHTQYTHVTHPQHHVTSHAAHYRQDYYSHETVERMEGVEHHGPKGPLVVMDGANIAYAYADAMSGFHQGNTEPDARGIQVAAQYFLSMDVRVLVVIPAPWFRAKPRTGDESQGTINCDDL